MGCKLRQGYNSSDNHQNADAEKQPRGDAEPPAPDELDFIVDREDILVAC